MTEPKLLGLIAGNGKFPFLFAREARRKGYRLVAVGIKGDTSFLLKPLVDEMVWVRAGELKKLFGYFQDKGVEEVVMAGQVSPSNLFDTRFQPDEEFRQLFESLRDRKADTIFSAVAQKLHDRGMTLLDSTVFLNDYLAPKGTLGCRAPTERELEDITFGCTIAKAMGGLDVGQTVVVKDRAIVAIEAMEGTDRTILRGGKIARQGAVVVKMSKPAQDLRFDVPVIGPKTIACMRRSHAACLAVEAGKTLILEREKTVKQADRHQISIVAV